MNKEIKQNTYKHRQQRGGDQRAEWVGAGPRE